MQPSSSPLTRISALLEAVREADPYTGLALFDLPARNVEELKRQADCVGYIGPKPPSWNSALFAEFQPG